MSWLSLTMSAPTGLHPRLQPAVQVARLFASSIDRLIALFKIKIIHRKNKIQTKITHLNFYIHLLIIIPTQ